LCACSSPSISLLAESNEADYSLEIQYVNSGPYWNEANDYGMEFDIGAPVTGVCASFSASAADTTTSLPATPCPVTVPPGAMLSAGTTKVPGGECTGNTIIKLVDGADDTDLQSPGFNDNAVENDGACVACVRALGCEQGALRHAHASHFAFRARRLPYRQCLLRVIIK
jgi:hypothetical protein